MTQTALTGLVTPPRLPQGTLRIVPLGGLGEIGRNMAVFEINGKLLVVDCGVLFPEETQPGVDLILPDFSYIEAKLQEHRIKPYTLTVAEGQVEQFGPFECEFVAVNHSMPDALAVVIRTAGGTVLHTGDFK